MKRIFAIIAVLAVTEMCSFTSHAQTNSAYSLDDCMRYAIENAPKTKIKAVQNQILRDEKLAAGMGFLPSVSGGVGASANFGRSIDPETNVYSNYTTFNNSYSLSAGWTVFDGFSVVNNFRIAKNAKELGIAEQQQVEDELCLEVIQAYYNVIYYSQMSALAQQQLDEANQNLKFTQSQEKQGLKSYADVAEIEALVAEKDYNLVMMQNNYANALSVLKQKMYFPMGDELKIENNVDIQLIEDTNSDNVEEILAFAKENHPSMLVAKNNIEAARLNFKTSKWQMAPSLYAYAGYSTGYINSFAEGYNADPFWQQMTDRQGEYVQLNLNIPIFNGLSRQTNMKIRKNNWKIAQYEFEQKTKDLEVEIELAVQDRDAALKAFVQADKRANSQAVAYKLNQKRYEQGLISALELQASGNNRLESEAARLYAYFTFVIKSKVVNYYKGVRYLGD
ncbi:MAG: TolC family protein [Bacteroidales bacterium]|nr:TolC family protein [Bacteroidales bacterium]